MSQLAIIVIVVLMPGILAASVADKLTVHSKWDSFKFPLYALIFGVLTYSLLQLVLYGWDVIVYVWSAVRSHRPSTPSWTSLAIWSIAQDGNSKIRPVEVVAAVVLAGPVAFIVAACVQHKIITRVGNFLRVTPKYGDENLYTYFMNAQEIDWIYVRDKDSNLTYEGRVGAFF